MREIIYFALLVMCMSSCSNILDNNIQSDENEELKEKIDSLEIVEKEKKYAEKLTEIQKNDSLKSIFVGKNIYRVQNKYGLLETIMTSPNCGSNEYWNTYLESKDISFLSNKKSNTIVSTIRGRKRYCVSEDGTVFTLDE